MAGQPPRPSDQITIGQVVGPHGIKGAVKIKPSTDFLERFEPGKRVFISGQPYTIKRTTTHKTQIRIETKEIRDRNQAEELQWAKVTVPADELPDLDEDEFYTSDLIGLRVIDESGRELGKVDDIYHSPAHDILMIGKGMIPAVQEFVKDVDLDAGVITVAPIPGMLEEE